MQEYSFFYQDKGLCYKFHIFNTNVENSLKRYQGYKKDGQFTKVEFIREFYE